MVTFIRTVHVNGADKVAAAQEWAKNATKYVDGKFGFTDVAAGIEVYGATGRMCWTAHQESLESLATGVLQSATDAGYQDLLMRGANLFVAGSVRDVVVLNI